MKILLINFFLLVSLTFSVNAAQFESNLVKGGKLRCYENGDAILCFKSACANAFFEEIRTETTTAQRKKICADENKKADFVGKIMLRSMANPAFAREFKGVIP